MRRFEIAFAVLLFLACELCSVARRRLLGR
jgi:hypothetical protein